jgi:hypothetical protein
MEKTTERPEKVLRRAKERQLNSQTVAVKEYYTDSEDLDVDAEISRISELPKTEENILRLENLKRIRTKRRWIGKWFENTCEELQKHSDKKRQFIMHTNPKFYWPWNPETIIVDTTFVDLYKDGSVKVNIFEGHPLLIDFAESEYVEVTGRNTLNKINRILVSSDTETIRFDKLM